MAWQTLFLLRLLSLNTPANTRISNNLPVHILHQKVIHIVVEMFSCCHGL